MDCCGFALVNAKNVLLNNHAIATVAANQINGQIRMTGKNGSSYRKGDTSRRV